MSSESEKAIKTISAGSIFIFAGMGIRMIFELGVRILLGRHLSVATYGLVVTFIIIFNLLLTLSLLGLHEGIARYLPRVSDENLRQRMIFTSILFGIGATGVVSLILGLVGPDLFALWNEKFVNEFAIHSIAIMLPPAAFMQLILGFSRGDQRTRPQVLIKNIILPVSSTVLVGIAIFTLDIEGPVYLLLYLSGYLFAAAAALFLFRRSLAQATMSIFGRVHAISIPISTNILRFSLPLLGSSLLFVALNDISMLLLGYFGMKNASGIYYAADTLSRPFLYILISVSFLSLPKISELHSRDETQEADRIYKIFTKWLTFLMMPVVVVYILFSKTVISVTFGESFTSSGHVLTVLAFGFYINLVMGMNENVLVAFGRPKAVAISKFVAVISTTGIGILLIPRIGVSGASIATTAGYIFMNVLLTTYLYLTEQIQPFTTNTLYPVCITLLVAVLTKLLVMSVELSRLKSIILFTLIYIPSYITLLLVAGGVEREDEIMITIVENATGISLPHIRAVLRRFNGE